MTVLLLGENPLEATRELAPYTCHAHVRNFAVRESLRTGAKVAPEWWARRRFLALLHRLASSLFDRRVGMRSEAERLVHCQMRLTMSTFAHWSPRNSRWARQRPSTGC